MTEVDPYQIAGEIRRALLRIIDHYDEALIPPKMTASVKQPTAPLPPDARKMKPARKVWAHSPEPTSLAVIDARSAAHADLAFYARIVLDEVKNVHGNTITTFVNGESPYALARFLDTWALRMAEDVPYEAEACARFLTAHGEALLRHARPNRREWVKLGRCPFVVEDRFCHGEVRGYGEEGQAVCTDCEQYGPTEWWEEVMIGGVGALLTYDQIIPFIHRAYGRVIARPTLRTWLRRQVLVASGTDEEGRTLYSREAVVFAMSRAA